MIPVFADPKTDFVFKRVFGSEAHKGLLIELLNTLLELAGEHRIIDLTYLQPEQRPPVAELKLSVVDVKCRDAKGVQYVVEMQVLNVEAFEKRVVYNVSKSYVTQLRSAEEYPTLDDVIGVTLCDFTLFGEDVPLLSRWRMQEQHCGVLGLSQVQYVFLELPKYKAGASPASTVERWAYFFREAENLDVVPEALAERPFSEALDVARTAGFSAAEWEAYDRAKMAEQDARGAAIVAHMEGLEQGLGEARAAILDLCEALGVAVSDAQRAALRIMGEAELRALRQRLKRERRVFICPAAGFIPPTGGGAAGGF